jgi:tight adherence protein B
MTLAFLALAVAVLMWPVPQPGERRLLGLAGAARLAGPAPSGLGLPWRRLVPSRAVILVAALGVGGLATAWRGPAVGLAVAVVGAMGLWCAARALRRASARVTDRDLSAALRLVRGELEVGSSAAVALTAGAAVAGVHRPAFEAAATALADGEDVVAAVTAAGGEPELIVIAQALGLAATLGTPLSGVLARVDDDVQARRDQARLVASALAGPRSSAALLAGLPVLGVVLGMAMGAHPVHVLLETTAGRVLLCVGVLLDALGVVWTARLISSAEGPGPMLAANGGANPEQRAALAQRTGATLAAGSATTVAQRADETLAHRAGLAQRPGATLAAGSTATAAQRADETLAHRAGRAHRNSPAPRTEARQ